MQPYNFVRCYQNWGLCPFPFLWEFFLKLVECDGLFFASNLPFPWDLFLLFWGWLGWKFFSCTMWALEAPSATQARVSFALAFSSKWRVLMRSKTENSCLLFFREVAKSFHEGGSLAMMVPATNLSGNSHLKYSSSLESDYISWVCWTTERSSVIL